MCADCAISERMDEQVSIASLSRMAFGSRSLSAFCTLAFVAQIFAMLTSQLVKTAELATLAPRHMRPRRASDTSGGGAWFLLSP